VGEAVRQALIRNEGLPKTRVGVIHNGVDVNRFSRDCGDRAVVRKEIGVAPGDLVIVQVARLDYLKDHATAIRMLEIVLQQRSNVQLILVGDGPERSGIESLVNERNLVSNVRFMGQRSDVPRLLAAADIFLLTSISEGIPLTVIEAMATKLPVVATNVGGLAELVEEGQTGLLAAQGASEELARCIIRLAESPELRRTLGEAGRQRAHLKFSETQMHNAYVDLFEEMMSA